MNREVYSQRSSDPSIVTSVGRNLGNSVYSNTHPIYRKVVDRVNEEIAKVTTRESVRTSRAVPALMTLVLSTLEYDAVAADYPEFRLVNYGVERPGHAYYVASQTMANELILENACSLTDSVTHLGGSLLSSLFKKNVDIHMEMDNSYRSAVHFRNRDTRNTARVMSDYATLAADLGDNVGRVNYDRYLAREAFVSCSNSARCCRQSQAFCADLSSYSMNPTQFCAAMVQCEAEVGYGFFPYDPLMLIADQGEIGNTGVFFDKRTDVMRYKYPEGVMGLESCSLRDWAAWLCEHVVRIGTGVTAQVFHIQLSKARGPFMFFQVTKVSSNVEIVELRHALDLPMHVGQYVVSSAGLKDLASDPNKPQSWERVTFTAPAKVVDDLVAFGMQLEADQFTRYALRKRLKVLDRVTVEGSVVVKTGGLSHTQIDLLVTAVHSHLFVQRYDSGQLSKEMMNRLKAVARFGKASFWSRVAAVGSWSLANLWDMTFGTANDSMLSMCEWIEKKFSSGVGDLPSFTMAPEYVSFETISSTWRKNRGSQYVDAVRSVENYEVMGDAVKLKGSLLSNVLSATVGVGMQAALAGARYISEITVPTVIQHTKHVAHMDSIDVDGTAPVLTPTSSVELREALVDELRVLNAMDEPSHLRHQFPVETVVRMPSETEALRPDYDPDPDPVGTFNEVYEVFNPGVAAEPLWYDLASISYDDQDRSLWSEWLRIPRLMDSQPSSREYYMSNVLALGAPKRQETAQELLSAAAARNLAAPKISLPQDYDDMIPEIWDNFLKVMCVPGARDKLKSYQTDPVALEEDAYRQWMAKAKPGILENVLKELVEECKAFDEMPVGEYLMMLKADVKPPLSDKPLRSRIEPQVIVHHKKALSSMYSSIFRILVRRFLSLLRPEIHVNLLKDSKDIAAFIRGNHPYGANLKYLENDFSKYDKSQDEFIFRLESYVFLQLGMNHALLHRWLEGHTDCNIRSVNTGISLRVRFQRKSGDATTAFGNVLVNIVSVAYAYAPSGIAWGVFMGDDSLLACHAVGNQEAAVAVLAEVFNLTAKMYITDAPYFASNFVVIDQENSHVELVPDPIKRIEKWSQPISALDPQWRERYISAADACSPYMHKFNTHALAKLVANRYNLPIQDAAKLPSAIATVIASQAAFRQVYQKDTEFIHY